MFAQEQHIRNHSKIDIPLISRYRAILYQQGSLTPYLLQGVERILWEGWG